MDKLLTGMHKFSRLSVSLFGAGYLLVAIFTTADVLMRKFFSAPLTGVVELSGYVFAISTVWGLSYCLFERTHVRIDAAYRFLSPTLRAWLDIVALAGLLIFVAMLTWRAYGTLLETIEYQSRSITSLQTPIWIPQSIWVAGFVFFLVSNVLILVYALYLVLTGQLSRVNAIAGIPHAGDVPPSEFAQPGGSN